MLVAGIARLARPGAAPEAAHRLLAMHQTPAPDVFCALICVNP